MLRKSPLSGIHTQLCSLPRNACWERQLALITRPHHKAQWGGEGEGGHAQPNFLRVISGPIIQEYHTCADASCAGPDLHNPQHS